MPSEIQFTRRVPQGDDIERAICDRCGFVDYENPKIVAIPTRLESRVVEYFR